MSLMQEMADRALKLGVPITVHLDLTYRCNERCVHCYLDHDDDGEMTLAEIRSVLDQVADAGTFFLCLSGGEIFMRRDFFEILAYARQLMFSVKLKTNGVMIRASEARRIAELGVQDVQVSIYSSEPEVHDGITRVPGSLRRSLDAVRLLKAYGVRVTIANVLMTANLFDDGSVMKLARDLGVSYSLDPMVTPKIDGDTSILGLRAPLWALQKTLQHKEFASGAQEPQMPSPASGESGEYAPCSAGHSFCYISPYGDVFPCVQFPLPSGNVRRQGFLDIWRHSSELAQVRSIRLQDLSTCSRCSHANTCARCPGLAYMEGDMRGPSTADCQQSFAKTGVPSAHRVGRGGLQAVNAGLVQIMPAVLT